ncbi:MAG: tetratricopeptide repeat protein, partial [Bacteroidota bacterium]
TMRDLMRFDRMLDNGTVCSKSMKAKAFTRFQSKKGEAFPYGLGVFAQDIGGASVVWSYGQYDCFSSLYLKVLDSDLTLVLLANNNLMSDPARLINGDIRYSLFARAFFRHFLQEDGATKQAWMSRATQKGEGYVHQELDDLYAIALARSFMAEGYAIEEKRAIDVMKLALSLEPNLEERASLPVLHCLIRLMGLNHAQTFDEAIDRVSTILRKRYPKDPYALYYQAAFRQHQGKTKEAIRLLETLVQLENHQIWWYTIDAHYQLGTFYRELNPAKARTHFERIVAIGWDIGGKVKLSKYILNEMNGKE